MKKKYHLILSIITICLLLGCENESFKETIIVEPKITTDLYLYVSAKESNIMTMISTDNIPVTYSLIGEDFSYFNLDQTTGEVSFKTKDHYDIKKSYSFSIIAMDNSNNYTVRDVIVNLNNINKPDATYPNFISHTNHDPITEIANNKKIFITLNPPISSDDIEIINYKWSPEITILSEIISSIKLVFFKESENETSIDKNTFSKNAFDSLADILPMSEVGNFKSISLLTTEDITTTTLDLNSNLFFKITNNINRNFTINEFKIVCYYNNSSKTVASTEDKLLLNNGFLNSGESVSLGYTLSSTQEANYWVGTYVLTDIETKEIFTNSFVWNGRIY